ncbi:hypothetical protein [Streptomyces californicus]|uniref:hypothetical protein n=1 Tax=Streptomyces californicus TaxID=67351 RepID=UPI0033A7931A
MVLGGGPGDASAQLVLLQGVSLLRPEDAVFEAMLEGWTRQQRGGRRLQPKTISDRLRVVERFSGFANAYPWQWTASDLDDWMTHLIGVARRAESTIRSYQGAIRLFCDYVTSPHYQWPAECQERFGTHPVQICHEWNTVAHLVECEGRPGRRPMTRDELQTFFDYADEQVERAVRLGRKGALAAYRDATVFKVMYGWGSRCTETSRLDTVDFHRNAPGVSNVAFCYLSHYAWMRVTRWIRRRHPGITWKQLRRRYYGGGWWPVTEESELFNPAKVSTTRYRYRGKLIPAPWPTTA